MITKELAYTLLDGEEEAGIYPASSSKNAAIEASKDVLEPEDTKEIAEDHPSRLYLKHNSSIFVYDGWAWEEEREEDESAPWLPDTEKQVDVDYIGKVDEEIYRGLLHDK